MHIAIESEINNAPVSNMLWYPVHKNNERIMLGKFEGLTN